MQKAVSDEKQQMFDNVMKLQDKSRDLLTDIMNNFDGFDMDDLSSTDQSYLVNLAADGGIPASILWQALHANKSAYLLTQAKKQADLTQKLQDSSDVESWADAENWVKDNSDKSYDEAYLYLSQHFDKILDNSDKKALLKRYGISTEEEGATFDETKIGIKLDVEMYQNNGYTREEAGTSVGISLKDALGVEKKGELPQVYSDAIEEALDAAYGSAASGKGGVWNLDYFKTMLKSTLFPGLSTSGKNE